VREFLAGLFRPEEIAPMQHNAHVNARVEWMLRAIYEALGIAWGYDLADWYACGDELI
jgi:hypothetical protein